MEFIPDKGQGHKASDFGLIMTKYPIIPAAKKIYNTYTIPGRAGQLVQDTKTKENIVVPVTLVELAEEKTQFQYRDYIRQITRWLNRGSGWLQFSDEQNTRYRVITIQVAESERITPIYGEISMEITIEPYEYVANGFLAKDHTEIKYNGYDLCKPIYYITGNTTGYITVNGVRLAINSIDLLTIDTEKQITFKTVDGEIENQAITGDYKDLWLPTGDVEILATVGINVKVMPRWGWEL